MFRGRKKGTDYVVPEVQPIHDSASSLNTPIFQYPYVPRFYIWETEHIVAPERFIFDDAKFDEIFSQRPHDHFLKSQGTVKSGVEKSAPEQSEEISQLPAEIPKSPKKNNQIVGLRILLENVNQSYLAGDFDATEIYSLKQHWCLPLDFVYFLSQRELHAGFVKKRFQTTENNDHVFQLTMCFLSGGILSLSYDLEAKLTRGFWLSRDRDLLDSVLENVVPDTPHIRHPFFMPRQILHALVYGIENGVIRIISALGKVRGDIDNAVGNQYVDGFEYYFYRANKSYFQAIGDIWVEFEQAETLGKFILEGLSDLNKAVDSEQQAYFEEVVTFDMKRLQCFRRNIETREASVKRQIELLHNLINLRDGRVSQLIAETSAQIARESKRDSSASKALAVVATVFLPGTFIASLFATPFFNFEAPAGADILSRQFWIYWAVSIPLTVVVILLWFAWYRYTTKKNRIEDEKRASATSQSIFVYDFNDRSEDGRLKRDGNLMSKEKKIPNMIFNLKVD